MKTITHLTNDLQAELKRIGSHMQLESKSKSKPFINLNYKDWAWGNLKARSIQAYTIVGLGGKHLQLAEKGIIAGISIESEISKMATIIDNGLKNDSIFSIWQRNIQTLKLP